MEIADLLQVISMLDKASSLHNSSLPGSAVMVHSFLVCILLLCGFTSLQFAHYPRSRRATVVPNKIFTTGEQQGHQSLNLTKNWP